MSLIEFIEEVKEFERTHEFGIQRILNKNYKQTGKGSILIMKHPETVGIYKVGLTNTKRYEILVNKDCYIINDRKRCLYMIHYYLKYFQPLDFDHPEIGNELNWYEISYRRISAIIQYIREEYEFV